MLEGWALPAAVGAAVILAFAPVVAGRYAFSDDYPLLLIYRHGGSSPWFGNMITTFATAGRPISAFLYNVVFAAAGTIDDLRFIRLLAVVGIASIAVLFYSSLIRAGVKRSVAGPLAVLVCTLPPFQVIASWAALFVAPYAALLGAASSLVIARALQRETTSRRLLAGAVGLLLAALSIYQPAAMFFWVFLVIALIGARRDEISARRLVRAHFSVALIAIAVAFVAMKVVVYASGHSSPNAARSALTHDPARKSAWFLIHPLYQSLNIFELRPTPWVAMVVTAVAFGGLILLLKREGSPTFFVGLAIVLIPITFLPGLVASEDSTTFRAAVSLAALIALYACLGAVGWWLAIRDAMTSRGRLRLAAVAGRCAMIGFLALAVFCVLVAGRNVQRTMVRPQQAELQMLRKQVAALPHDVHRLAYVQLQFDGGPTHQPFADELGVPSSARPWSVEPSVLLLLAEEGRLPPNGHRPRVDLLPPTTRELPPDEPVVDLRSLGGG